MMRGMNRYAGNVTVKELLRAANKLDEPEDPLYDETSESADEITPTRPMRTKPERIETENNGPVVETSINDPTSKGNLQIVLPSSATLDAVLQTVVTTFHTTLPTANYKMPSPTTLLPLSPRKNLTRMTSSTIAPIPTVPRLKSPMRAALSVVASSGVVPVSGANRGGTVMLPLGGQVGRNQIIVLNNGQQGHMLQGLVAQSPNVSGAARMLSMGAAASSSARSQPGGPNLSNSLTQSQTSVINPVASVTSLSSSTSQDAALNQVSSDGQSPVLNLAQRLGLQAQNTPQQIALNAASLQLLNKKQGQMTQQLNLAALQMLNKGQVQIPVGVQLNAASSSAMQISNIIHQPSAQISNSLDKANAQTANEIDQVITNQQPTADAPRTTPLASHSIGMQPVKTSTQAPINLPAGLLNMPGLQLLSNTGSQGQTIAVNPASLQLLGSLQNNIAANLTLKQPDVKLDPKPHQVIMPDSKQIGNLQTGTSQGLLLGGTAMNLMKPAATSTSQAGLLMPMSGGILPVVTQGKQLSASPTGSGQQNSASSSVSAQMNSAMVIVIYSIMYNHFHEYRFFLSLLEIK